MNSPEDDDITRIKPDDDITLLRHRPYPGPKNETPEPDDWFNDDYSLRGAVGAGGVGRVLLGFDERIGREVAIKEMLDQTAQQDQALSARFLREARITGRLEHPGIVPVYDLGVKDSGAPYYVMRLVRGDTLAKSLKACDEETSPEHALSRRLGLLDRLIDVCEALAYAHSKGVIHRDIKPGNIVLGPFGETIILDWGLAKLESETEIVTPSQRAYSDDADLTRIGDVLGTPAYMAPEQADARFGNVDARSDVFSLGCMLHYLLAGHPPLTGSADEILTKLIAPEPMPSVRDLKRPAPPELIAICEKALAKDKSSRFANAGVLAEELRAYRDGRLVSTYAYSRGELLRRFVARNRIALGASAAVLIAILIGAGLAIKFGIEAKQSHQLAVDETEKAKRALADVTRISNRNLTVADDAAADIRAGIAEITRGMETTADSLDDLTDLAAIDAQLATLVQNHPRAESFAATRAPGTIIAVAPSQYRQAIGADTSQMEHNRLVIEKAIPIMSRVYLAPEGYQAVTLVVPIKRNGAIPGFISTRLKADNLLGGLLPQNIQTEARAIWVIQDDGLILYDTDTEEIGRNLFREERFLEIPELRQLAAQIDEQDAGVGYYQSRNAGQPEISRRIASWVTLHPAENRPWKVVVLEAW